MQFSVRRACTYFLCATLAMCFGAGCLHAQQARIFSGEHADFSRLALRLPQGVEWSYEQTVGGYNIYFQPEFPLSIDGIFNLIPHDRIEDVILLPEGDGIFIASTCNCSFEIQDLDNRVIAIDVSDKGLLEGVGGRSQSIPLGDFVSATSSAFTMAGRLFDFGTLQSLGSEDKATSRLISNDSFDPRTPLGGLMVQDELRETTGVNTQLERSLEQSLQAGLLEAGSLDRSGGTDILAGVGLTPDAATPLMQRNIDLRSPVGSLRESEPSEVEVNDVCADASLLEFMAEGSLEGALETLSASRARLVDARGVLSREGARKLVEIYLFLTFGAEARALLSAANSPEEEYQLLEAVSRIVEQQEPPNDEVLRGMEVCEEPLALWALLGQANGSTPLDPNVNAVKSGYFDLPVHLRLHLGEALVKRLEALGEADAASAIAANFDALRSDPIFALEGSLDDSASTPQPAHSQSGRDGQLDLALGVALEEMSRQRLASSQSLAVAAAFYDEYSDLPEGAQLLDLLFLSRAYENDLEGAWAIEAQRVSTENSEWAESFRSARSNALANLETESLLRLLRDERRGVFLDMIANEDLIGMSRRLVDIGFAQEAVLVAGAAQRKESDAWDNLLARAALKMGDARQAISLVAAHDDPEGATLRGEALLELGDLTRAARAFAIAGDETEASRAAWLSGDRATIEEFGTVPQRELLSLLDLAGVESEEAVPTSPGDAAEDASVVLGTPNVGSLPTSALSGPGSAEFPGAATATLDEERAVNGVLNEDSAPQQQPLPGEARIAQARDVLAQAEETRAALQALQQLQEDTE